LTSAEPQSLVSLDGYALIEVYGGELLSGYRSANVVSNISKRYAATPKEIAGYLQKNRMVYGYS